MAIRNQMFAVEMLLTLPSSINIAWGGEKDAQKAVAMIPDLVDTLNLSPEAREETVNLMVALTPMRGSFRGVGMALSEGEYGGSEPHPTDEESRALVAALKALDK